MSVLTGVTLDRAYNGSTASAVGGRRATAKVTAYA